jgi:hypothetical protein
VSTSRFGADVAVVSLDETKLVVPGASRFRRGIGSRSRTS